MADISKIKLPNNSEVNIKDSRIPGVTSSVTSGSTNVVTSGGVSSALGNYVPKSGCTMDEEAELTIPAYDGSDLSTKCSITTSAVEINDYISGYDIVLDGEYPALTVKSNIGNANQNTTHYTAENIVHYPTSGDTSYQYGFPAKSGTFAMTSDIPAGLPSVSSSDNGKVLQVSSGVWTTGILSGYLPLSGGTMTGPIVLTPTTDSTTTSDGIDFGTAAHLASSNASSSPLFSIYSKGPVSIRPGTGSAYSSSYGLYINDSEVQICGATSDTPTLRLRRGTTSDAYVDLLIKNNAGKLSFIRSTSGANTELSNFDASGFYPQGTITNNVSNLSLGLSTNQWSSVHAKDATFSGNVTATGTVTGSNIPTYHTGTSDPSSSLGSDGDIYIKLSS